MIQTIDLTFRYGPEAPEMRFPDLGCAKGDRMLLLGTSGAGKTTLLHLLSGLLRPSGGEIHVDGTDIGQLSDRALDRFRGERIGVVFQRAHFVQSLTVMENLALPSFLTGKRPDVERAEAMLRDLGVGHKATCRPGDLSIGEQQRASIARALVHRPSVLLVDEPTSALDDRSTEAVVSLLEQQAAEVGATLLIVTHDSRLKNRYDRRVELQSLSAS
ncbi:MAG: ABC transporter ATP-binding protein [Flavobacteriales bacterium]